MTVETLKPGQKQQNIAAKMAEIKNVLEAMQRDTMRKLFDAKVKLDSTAEAIIITAREFGFNDLAADMAIDMQMELILNQED